MPEPVYQDFDVAIEQVGDDRFRARVIDSPSGQARNEFVLPFSALELENFLLRIGRPRSGVRRLESPEAEAARSFGRRLFESVFDGDVATAWQRSLDVAERDDRGLRVRLRLGDAPGLAELPWEYLYLPAGDRHLVLSAWTPLIRYLDLPWGASPLTVQPPLRLLAMISDPTDVPVLDVDQEMAKLDESLQDLEEIGLVEVTRLERATLRELQRALRHTDYHIFHFIGHGGFDESAQDGVLVLENDLGGSRKVTGRELGTILHDCRTIRLAVLNSCEGARSGAADPFGGAAQSLAMAGVPAVIAMQFEITDAAAIVFAQELYAAVADGYAVEAALAEARRAIFGSGNDLEWGTPVLYLRADNGHLFDVHSERAPESPVEADVRPDVVEEPDLEEDLEEEEPVPVEIPEDHLPDVIPIITPEQLKTTEEESAEPEKVEEKRDEAITELVETSPPETETPPPPPPPQPRWVLVAAVLAGLALVVWGLSSLGNGDDDGGATTLDDGGGTTLANGGEDGGELEVLDSSIVTAVPLPIGVEIDGSLNDWSEVLTAYSMRFPIHQDDDVRLGEDSPGTIWVAYDMTGLYLAAIIEDDVYSQMNVGDQIWRGDALNINVSSVPPDQASETPDADDFQLTMTIFDSDGGPGHAWFQGTGAATFTTARTDMPVVIVGEPVAPTDSYDVEVFIPWEVFGMEGPPTGAMTALFTVFDNDGEENERGPVQRTILANSATARFQQPTTWGTLEFER